MPEQSLKNGIVNINVIEGKISEILINGKPPKDHILVDLSSEVIKQDNIHIRQLKIFLHVLIALQVFLLDLYCLGTKISIRKNIIRASIRRRKDFFKH